MTTKDNGYTPGPIMAGIERQIAHFRADPHDADATPRDVISVADYAMRIDRQRSGLLRAAQRVLNWHDRQGGYAPLPPEVEADLRAAIARAEGREG